MGGKPIAGDTSGAEHPAGLIAQSQTQPSCVSSRLAPCPSRQHLTPLGRHRHHVFPLGRQ